MYLLEKTISGKFKYWWNENTSTWEGLIQNATEIKESQLQHWKDKINPVLAIRKFINCSIIKI